MSTEVTLPALGESVTEGTVSRWLKEVGESVEVDEPLLEVSTDKVDTEIPSPVAGVLLEIKVEEDGVAEVGAVLAIVGDADESDDSDSDDESEDSSTEEPADEDSGADDDSADDQAEEKEESKPSKPSAGSGSGTEVKLPQLGESVTEGTVSRWLKEVGESVDEDEPLLEVSTDKVDTEIPSPVSGTLLEIKVDEDEVAQVGQVLAIVGDADSGDTEAAADEPQDVTDSAAEEPADEEAPQKKPQEKPQEKKAAAGSDDGDTGAPGTTPRRAEAPEDSIYVTPLVRKLAKEHDVELSSLKGTGVGGRIRKQDVLAAADEQKKKKAERAESTKAADEAAAKKPAEKPRESAAKTAASAGKDDNLRGTTQKVTRLRATIAKRMVESLQTSAQLTATVEVDLTPISRLRAKAKDDFKKREGASLSYLPFITKAVVEALKQFPKVNASMDAEAGTITYADAEHIGIAVATEKGLLVPVIKDAGDLNLAGIAKKIADLAGRTRASKVGPDELSGGTFTITNYGSAGTLFDTPIVNQPQVAILGTGALVKRAVVLTDADGNDTFAIRDMMFLSMSYDHRLVDGADAARFLSVVKKRLEDGDFAGEIGL